MKVLYCKYKTPEYVMDLCLSWTTYDTTTHRYVKPSTRDMKAYSKAQAFGINYTARHLYASSVR